jgi:hypothetical protein
MCDSKVAGIASPGFFGGGVMNQLCNSCVRSGIQRPLFVETAPDPSEGTACAREVVSVFEGRVGSTISAAELSRRLQERGQAASTIERTLQSLVRCGTLVKVRGGRRAAGGCVYELTAVAVPKTSIYSNVRRPVRGRFGSETNEEKAELVRELLIGRLDYCFESPSSELLGVLQAVETAGQLANAIRGGSSLMAAKEAAAGLLQVSGQIEGGLSAAALLGAIQVGLFPEAFNDGDQPSSQNQRLAAAYAKRDRRLKSIQEVLDENERRMIHNLKLRPGQEPQPLLAVDVDEFDEDEPIESLGKILSLVPHGGGERVGKKRLEAFLKLMGRG